jgi:hypothetical protein
MSNILSAQLLCLKNRVLQQKKQLFICIMNNRAHQKQTILTLDKALRINTLRTNGLGLDMLYDIIRCKWVGIS